MPQRVSSSVRVVTVLALAVSLAVAPVLPAAATTTPAAEALDRLARELVDAGAPGVIVRVDDGSGRPVEIARQAGWTRKDHLLGAGDEFREGSNTKTVMATLVLQLVAEGKLALTDPVEKWLPGQVPGGAAITLRMLLNHTSGLFDYTEDPAVLPSILGKDRRPWTSAELLAVGVKHDPLFAPGTKWSYSNTNYAAIGAVLEQVTGASLAVLVRDRIARPLHLTHTWASKPAPPRAARSGATTAGSPATSPSTSPTAPAAARRPCSSRRNRGPSSVPTRRSPQPVRRSRPP